MFLVLRAQNSVPLCKCHNYYSSNLPEFQSHNPFGLDVKFVIFFVIIKCNKCAQENNARSDGIETWANREQDVYF